MDQLTQNLERLRRNVDLQIGRILIPQSPLEPFTLSDEAFTNSAFTLPQGDEPFVVSHHEPNRSLFAGNERDDLILPATAQTEPRATQVPAIIKRSLFERMLSRLGF